MTTVTVVTVVTLVTKDRGKKISARHCNSLYLQKAIFRIRWAMGLCRVGPCFLSFFGLVFAWGGVLPELSIARHNEGSQPVKKTGFKGGHCLASGLNS